ncbi:MAG: hypothetical protein AAFX08_06600 [Pseudomonadota bacterium]
MATVAAALAAARIPFVIRNASERSERRRLTGEIIRSLTTTAEIMRRMERLYFYRRYLESDRCLFGRTRSKDPYGGDVGAILFDHVVVLNFYEAVCTEIAEGVVDFDLVYDAAANTIVGVHDVLLARYEALAEGNQTKDYPMLVRAVVRIRKTAASRGDVISEKIPELTGDEPGALSPERQA